MIWKAPVIGIILIALAPQAWSGDEKKGEKLFSDRSCVLCHSLGTEGTATAGPNLAGVTKRQDKTWLEHWIKSPDLMMKDPEIQKISGKYSATMPNMGLTDVEVDDLVSYLAASDQKTRTKKQ